MNQAKDLKDVDCILVLGAGVREDGTPSLMLNERLELGIALYQSGASQKLLMSGDHGRKDYDEVNTMKGYALSQGITSEDVFMDHAGFSTYESIYRAKEIFQAKKIIIVSQEYHLYRALYIADKFGIEAYGVAAKGTEEIPLEWGGKLVFINSIVGGSIDARFMPAILKGIMSRMEQGPLTGSYARDVRVIVYDGKMHPVDSNEISFMLAGRNAFSEAFKNAGPKILEPIYDVEVFVPSDKMGDVMSDLQGRRGMIMGMSSESGYEKLVAKVPLKEMSSYSTSLSSLTGGRASFIMKFASYELVPTDVQEKLMKEFEAKENKDD